MNINTGIESKDRTVVVSGLSRLLADILDDWHKNARYCPNLST